MSTRLQVVMDEVELAEIRAAADRSGVTVSEFARQHLRAASRRTSSADPARKLAAIRSAAAHQFPTGDISEVLAEIEAGYVGDTE